MWALIVLLYGQYISCYLHLLCRTPGTWYVLVSSCYNSVRVVGFEVGLSVVGLKAVVGLQVVGLDVGLSVVSLAAVEILAVGLSVVG